MTIALPAVRTVLWYTVMAAPELFIFGVSIPQWRM